MCGLAMIDRHREVAASNDGKLDSHESLHWEALVTGMSYRRRRVKPTPIMPSAPKSKDDGSGTGLDTGEEARLRSPVVVPAVVRVNATPIVSE